MRVETAARLLRYTEIPVKEIAYKVGYDVPSSLSKVFRQFYGISPNEYRNNKDYVIMEPNRIMPDMELKVEVKDLPGKPQERLPYKYRYAAYPVRSLSDHHGTSRSVKNSMAGCFAP